MGKNFSLSILFLFVSCILLPAQNIDLSIELSTTQNGFQAYTNVPVLLEINNTGSSDATDVEVEFKMPDGTAFSNATASAGNYNSWDGSWKIGNLASGNSHQLELILFTLSDAAPLVCFAQVKSGSPNDIDSTPGNNQSNTPNEDDEALLLIDPNGNNGPVSGETNFSKFPKDFQLIPRNLTTNQGLAQIAGSVIGSNAYEKLRSKLYRNDVFLTETDYELSYLGDQADFEISIPIPAELHNYRIEIYGVSGSVETYLNSAKDLVAGDVYLVNGQSNAQALVAPSQLDISNFTRSYHNNEGWVTLQFSNPGMWAARIAKNIVDQHQIPVAIFNEAVGAQHLDFYLRNDNNPYDGNYGQLLQRLENADVASQVRATLWWQGETDGWVTEPEDYKNDFQGLLADWQADFQIEKCYLYQLRYQSCLHPRPLILEAQRQLANDLDDVAIMSTSNANHDGCHFEYEEGYQDLGDRMYRLLAIDLYNGAPDNARAPDIIGIENTNTNEYTLEFNNVIGSLEIEGSPWNDFVIEGTSATVSSGFVDGNKLTIYVDGDASNLTGISYLCHPGNAPNWISNAVGVGLLSFHNVPLGTTIITPPPITGLDLEIEVSALQSEYRIYENVNFVVTVHNRGTETGSGIVIDCPYPEGLVYTDAGTSQGDFSAWLQEWNLGALAAGESATLNLTLFTLVSDQVLQQFVQVKSVIGDDIDSTPGNNQSLSVSEDDEASVIINPQGSGTTNPNPRLLQFQKSVMVKGVFPNPASDQLVLHMESTEQLDLQLEFGNILGAIIYTENISLHPGENLIQIQIDQLPEGCYFIRSNGAHAKHDIIRFIKQVN